MPSSREYGQESHGKKKLAMVGVSAVVLVAMVVGVAVTVSHGNHGSSSTADSNPDVPRNPSVKAIQSICQPTDYKEACVNTLKAAAGSNVTDPTELVKLVFKVAADQVKNVFNHSAVLKQAATDPRTAHALDNCQELLDYAIDDLKNSWEQLGGFDLSKLDKVVEDLKIWLSAAITYEETCLDGFENTTGDAGASMRKAMNASMELTQNALAIVNDASSILTSFNVPFFNRRLLSDKTEEPLPAGGFPRWVDARRRRLLEAGPGEVTPNIVVAKDGSGNYTTINDALLAVPKFSNNTFVMYIKEGVYEEQVQVNRSMTYLMMIGDGPTKTRITGNLNFVDGTPTFKTATVAVIGDGFIAKNIGFENAAGAAKHQAVALRVQSDMSIFYNCQMDGYQDTLYAHTMRQFYRECTISGTIDFIFGNSAVVFQNCAMLVRKPLDNQQNIVTAQGRKDRREPTAIILHNCTITAHPEFDAVRTTPIRTYLGRPWKEYSRTFIMQSQIDDLIHPQGWLPWMGDFGLRTCFYTEYDNRGPGAGKAQRVTWRGIKTISDARARKFTVERFLRGSSWIAPTGIPYTLGLLPVSSESSA